METTSDRVGARESAAESGGRGWPPEALRRLFLLGTPLLAAVALAFHTFGVGQGEYYDRVAAGGDQWLAVHLLFLPLLVLLAGVLFTLLRGRRGLAPTVGRLGTATFATFYVALEAIAGIAAGVVVRATAELPAEQRAGAVEAVDVLFTHPIVGGATLSAFVGLAILGYVVAVVATAVTLRRAGAPWPPLALLVASVLGVASHGVPTGPIGMLFLFGGVAWLELRWDEAAA